MQNTQNYQAEVHNFVMKNWNITKYSYSTTGIKTT